MELKFLFYKKILKVFFGFFTVQFFVVVLSLKVVLRVLLSFLFLEILIAFLLKKVCVKHRSSVIGVRDHRLVVQCCCWRVMISSPVVNWALLMMIVVVVTPGPDVDVATYSRWLVVIDRLHRFADIVARSLRLDSAALLVSRGMDPLGPLDLSHSHLFGVESHH